MSPVFISKGMSVGIPAGGLTISVGPDGRVTGNVTLHVRFDACPIWLEIARKHLGSCVSACTARRAAWAGGDEQQKGPTLEREFEVAMQAIVASAIAVDAFYAGIQPHMPLPSGTVETWRRRRTARHVQVAEVLRRAFNLKPKGAAALRNNLKEIFRFRGLAVHPPGKMDAPILHPELKLGVEWRFAYFSGPNAEAIFRAAASIPWDLSHNGKAKNDPIKHQMTALAKRMEQIFPEGFPPAPLMEAPP